MQLVHIMTIVQILLLCAIGIAPASGTDLLIRMCLVKMEDTQVLAHAQMAPLLKIQIG